MEVLDHVYPQHGHFTPLEYARVSDPSGTSLPCAEREKSHAVATDHNYPMPDIYVNHDVTMTVDPIRNVRWIRTDGDACRHALSEARGRHDSYVALTTTLEAMRDQTPPARNFMPTSSMMDDSLKFSGYCLDNSTRGPDARAKGRGGELPQISHMLYYDQLPDTVDWLVEKRQWRNQNNRVFDCEGWCR